MMLVTLSYTTRLKLEMNVKEGPIKFLIVFFSLQIIPSLPKSYTFI